MQEKFRKVIDDLNYGDTAILPLNIDKIVLAKAGYRTDGVFGHDYNWNQDFKRIGLGINKESNYVVLDFDRPGPKDDRLPLTQAQLITIDYILREFKNIIGYPTVNGAHFIFKEQDIAKDFYHRSVTGTVLLTGAGPVDYLANHYVGIGMMSQRTGEVELFADYDLFGEGELCQEAVELFRRHGHKTELTRRNLENSPLLPIELLPFGSWITKDGKERLPLPNEHAGRNNELTKYAGTVNKYVANMGLNETMTRHLMKWVNTYVFADQLEEREIEKIKLYKVSDEQKDMANNIAKAATRKAKKSEDKDNKIAEKIKHIKDNVDLSDNDVNWAAYFDIKETQKADIATFLIEALNIRLLNGTTLVLKRGQRDIIDSSIVASVIIETRPGGVVDVNWAHRVMEIMVIKLKTMIEIDFKFEYQATYVSRPLWIDRNGLCIDPFNITTDDGKVKLQTREQLGIEQDVVPFHLNLDFNNLQNYNKEAYELLHKWIGNGVGYKQDKIDYFFRYFGYTWMIGKKFTRQIGMIGGITGSGKTTLTEIISKTIFGAGKAAKANANLFDGKFGLQPVGGKAWAILDEGASAFRGNSEDLKRVSGAETTLVEPKGKAAVELFIPKITVLFNHLPEELDYSDPAVMNRLAIMYLEKPLTNDFNSDTLNVLERFGGEALFLHILNTYRTATRADITTSEGSTLWVSPFQGYLEEHLEEANVSKYWHIETLATMNRISIEGKNSSTITKEILGIQDFTPEAIEAKAFIKANVRNLSHCLKELGYVQKTSKKLWTKIAGGTEDA